MTDSTHTQKKTVETVVSKMQTEVDGLSVHCLDTTLLP